MPDEDLLAELAGVASAVGPAIAPGEYDELLRALTETARQLFGAKACSLALLTEDESELVYTTVAGAGAVAVSGMRMPSGRGVAGWVVMSGQPVAIADLQHDARFARDIAEHVAEETGYVPQALLAVPVVLRERTLGVLTLLDRDADRPGADQDMTLLSLFAHQAALAIQASTVFHDMGRVLLSALVRAVGTPTTLATALMTVADAGHDDDADLAALAALFADLQRQGPAERRLALRLVREVAAFTGESRRPAE